MCTFLAPIEYAISLAGNLGGDITGSVNKIRGFFNYLRNMVAKTVKSIFNIFILFFDLIKVPNTPRKVIDGNSNPSLSIDNSEIGI